MTLFAQLAAVLAIASTGVVYGTDTFCALVIRPALGRVDDTTLTAMMGNVHRYGDRRMPAPGMTGLLAAAVASILAVVAGHAAEAATAGAGFVLLATWVVLYLRISAPINRRLTAAADAHETPADARMLQRNWDRIIVPRALLQGSAVALLCVSLIS